MSNFSRVDASGNMHNSERPEYVKVVAEATSLTADDHGKVISIAAAAGAQVDLPAVADISAGFKVKFTVGQAFATSDWTIVSATNVIQGHAIVDGAHVAASNENTISFVATADSVGDFVEVEFDGTNFIAFGSGVSAGSITFTAP
jgi:hypothetical protein